MVLLVVLCTVDVLVLAAPTAVDTPPLEVAVMTLLRLLR
jgi:hypothetical protein